MRRMTPGRLLSLVAATALALGTVAGPAAGPALAADLCTGTAAVDLTPGVHLTVVRTIHVTEHGDQAGTLLCAVDPLFGTLLAKTVDVHVAGTCIATSLDTTQASTIVVRFPGESSDSTINITGVALGATSLSKVITFNGTVRAGDPRQNQNTQLVIASLGPTPECATTTGLTLFSGVATFLFT